MPPTGFDVPSSGVSASSQVRGGIVLGVLSSEQGGLSELDMLAMKNEYRLSHGSVNYSPSFAHSPLSQSAAARRMRRRQSRRRPVLPYASEKSRGAILQAR